MIFWTTMSRMQYIVRSISIAILPLITGLFVAVSPVWSDFWWGFTLLIVSVWLLWILICALIGVHNEKTSRLLPLGLLLNLSFSLPLIALWRISEESIFIGVLLLFSHVMATIFSFLFSKLILERDFKGVNPLYKIFQVIILILPILWIFFIFYGDLFVTKLIRALGISILAYYLNFYLTAASIRFREPNWKPTKKKASL